MSTYNGLSRSASKEYTSISTGRGYDCLGQAFKTYTVDPTLPDRYATRTYYDAEGRVVKVVDPQQWADNGNAPDPLHTTYTYNNAGWLIETTNAQGTPTKYVYNKNGWRTELWYWQQPPFSNNNAIKVLYTYYPDGALASIDQPGYSGRNITTFAYDPQFGNLTLKTCLLYTSPSPRDRG